MTQQHAASALLQAALRRQLVSMKEALDLRHVLAGCDADPHMIRTRLQAPGVPATSDTIAALLGLLPSPQQDVIGDYRRLALLGQSPIGDTWLALAHDKLVVLKTLAPALCTADMGSDIATLLNGDQRYLVTYLAWLEAPDGACTLVQSYRPGRDARERQALKGPASEVRALTILRHAAKGLAQLQNLGRCHGHLQPKSLLLDNDGRVALTDYGLAASATGHRHGWTADYLQRVPFAAPEECGEAPSPSIAGDIYALGCIGYWLLSGEPPFPGTAERQQLQHLHADRPDVRTVAPGVSELTAKTLLKAMHINPTQRYVHALVSSLERNLDLLEQPQHDTEAKVRGELSGSQAVSSLILNEPE